MSNLIKQQKSEHVELLECLKQVRAKGIVSDESQDLLKKAKSSLLRHLAVEDVKLYPVLRRAGKTDPALQSTLDTFAKDMEQVSKAAMTFFATYANGGDRMQFAKDFGELYAALTNRIGKEERILYPAFDAL